jgi:hypothetical protein
MDNLSLSTLMIDALTELAEEEQAHHVSHTIAAGLPTLESVIANASPLPREAILLGIAEDGLPVLLNLNDPIPGPILIAGDQASGKTKFLQMIARAAELLHTPAGIQYVVITQFPEEWAGFQENQINAGIYSAQHSNTHELLQSLFDWAHNNKGEERSILLIIDNFESIKNIDSQAGQNLRWLLLRGPSRRVWPIIAVNIHNARKVEAWLAFFRTRVFGRIQNAQDSNFIAGYASETLKDLASGSQFAMREGNKWLKFWSPSID